MRVVGAREMTRNLINIDRHDVSSVRKQLRSRNFGRHRTFNKGLALIIALHIGRKFLRI
jgi:hypothetical protein